MTVVAALDDLRSARTSNGAPSARNLIVTVFGDAVLPLGDDTALSVQALSQCLEGFEVNERLVRTSLTRLVNDGLLSVERNGRRSQYRVANDSLTTFRHADRRIYRGERSNWDGGWTTVVADPEAPAAARSSLRDELEWFGFRSIGPNVWVSPTVQPDALAPLLDVQRHRVAVAVTRAPALVGADWLAERTVDVADLADRYRAFTSRFAPFSGDVITRLDPAEAFKLRTLLIASFRRIVVNDPALPTDLLPSDWPENAARRTARSVYDAIAEPSTKWFGEIAGIGLQAPVLDRFTIESPPPLG